MILDVRMGYSGESVGKGDPPTPKKALKAAEILFYLSRVKVSFTSQPEDEPNGSGSKRE